MSWTKILEQVSKIQIKSITDSLFKYGLYIFVLATISGIFKTEPWITILLFAVGGLFEFIGLGFYFYFAKKNPDYLRSESFQLKKQSIEMLGDKDNNLNPHVKNIVFIASPFSKELGQEDDKMKFGE
ncbi:MAG: hypothetical protein V4608_09735 [Bacteroidota bacterium]